MPPAQEIELLQEYLRVCRRTPGIVFALNNDVVMMNDYARTVLAPADQDVLLRLAAEALAARRDSVLVELPTGTKVKMYLRAARPAGSSAAASSTRSWPRRRHPRARTVARRPGCSSRESSGPAPCGGVPATRWRTSISPVSGSPSPARPGSASWRSCEPCTSAGTPAAGSTCSTPRTRPSRGWLAGATPALLEDVGGDNAGTVVIRHVDRLDGVHLRSLTAAAAGGRERRRSSSRLGRRDLRPGRCEQGARPAAATVPEHGGGPAAASPRRGHPATRAVLRRAARLRRPADLLAGSAADADALELARQRRAGVPDDAIDRAAPAHRDDPATRPAARDQVASAAGCSARSSRSSATRSREPGSTPEATRPRRRSRSACPGPRSTARSTSSGSSPAPNKPRPSERPCPARPCPPPGDAPDQDQDLRAQIPTGSGI